MTPIEERSATGREVGDAISDAGTDTFDARWARWQAKGRADDAQTRRRARGAVVVIAGALAIAAWVATRG